MADFRRTFLWCLRKILGGNISILMSFTKQTRAHKKRPHNKKKYFEALEEIDEKIDESVDVHHHHGSSVSVLVLMMLACVFAT